MEKKTKKAVTPVEILSQLDQFRNLENFDWTENSNHALELMITATINLIEKYVPLISAHSVFNTNNSWMLQIDERFSNYTSLPEILSQQILSDQSIEQKFLIINFKDSQKIDIADQYHINGKAYHYRCHIRERGHNVYESHFKNNGEMVYDYNGDIHFSHQTQFEENIKMIVLSNICDTQVVTDPYIYNKNAMKTIRNQYLSVVNPQLHKEKLIKRSSTLSSSQTEQRKEYEAKRNQSEERKAFQKTRYESDL